MTDRLAWVVLTQGTRRLEVGRALASIRAHGRPDTIVVVENGGTPGDYGPDVEVVRPADNLGVPGGRDLGVRATSADVVGFLDDDAELVSGDVGGSILATMRREPSIGAVAFRIVDEAGETQRRHVPRPGSRSAARSGSVATFLGGACAIRRSAYDDAGGYWPDLVYAHEELDLSWRMIDRGHVVHYDADILVRHPRLPISRHGEGWRLTGRNRVLIARRDLPWLIVAVHTLVWLALGVARAPGRAARRGYVSGWLAGWRPAVPRRPIRWSTVARLARLGRPPLV
jgi:glycosyltransferase involved in cell wall biosynthesis